MSEAEGRSEEGEEEDMYKAEEMYKAGVYILHSNPPPDPKIPYFFRGEVRKTGKTKFNVYSSERYK